MKQYDLLSVDLGWSGKELRRVALSFLDSKNKKIYCIYNPRLSLREFLLLLKENLKPKSLILLDIPLKGRVRGFFRPLERAMQKVGLPCRPSRNALVKGRRLSLEIEALGFKAIEIYPYGFYKFYCMLLSCHAEPCPEPVSWIGSASIDLFLFKRFFPPYKRAGERGLKNAKRVIKEFLNLLTLKLAMDRNLKFKSHSMRWDIYDSVFGVIAGYLLLKHSPWVKIIKDKTGSEILILSDERILGSGEFVEKIITEAEEQQNRLITGGSVVKKVKETIRSICKEEGIKVTEIKGGSQRRQTSRIRKRIAKGLIEIYGIPLAIIARETGVTTTAVSKMLAK